MDDNDANWSYWQNHTDQAHQHENLRAQAGAIIASAAGVVVAIVAEDGIGRDDAITSIVVVLSASQGLQLQTSTLERPLNTMRLQEARAKWLKRTLG